MLNQRTESNPLRSSLALKIRCAMYPPPPGSAPGYQKDHHCTPILTKNVTTGRTHNASAEIGREKSGKNDVASPAPGAASPGAGDAKSGKNDVASPAPGDAARISPSLLNSAAIPPQAETAYHATPITIAIFKAN